MSIKLTNIGEIIHLADKEIKIDKHIKNILSYKPILARIFKETIIECKDMSYEQIEMCIEGDIQVDFVGVNPGTTNIGKIEGRTQEDAIIYEGSITFDLRTVLRIPNHSLPVGVKLLIDVEAQKDDTPGYDISERAIFYCGRMLSAQLTTEFSNSTGDNIKYSNLKKVYSIWICTEVAQKRANTIERYNIQRTVYPCVKSTEIPRYDLLEAVIVNISGKHDTDGSQSELIRMLTDLFNEEISSIDKINILKREYNIPTTLEFEEEVLSMTSYAANLIRKGKAEGEYIGRVKLVADMIRKDTPKDTILKFATIEEYNEALNLISSSITSN